MDKISNLAIGLIIAAGVMLVIPIPMGHVAKASTCNSSTSSASGFRGSFTIHTTSGSCSTAGSNTQHSFSQGVNGGQKSSCSSASTDSQGDASRHGQSSNGAVSCSSHTPF